MASAYEKVMESRRELAEKIIENMKKGYVFQPAQWSTSNRLPYNPASNCTYRGGNKLKLLLCAMENNYSDPRWCTVRQANSKGWKVKKGEHGTLCEKWIFTKEVSETDPITKEVTKTTVRLDKPQVSYFIVFNGEQIEGIPPLVPRKELQPDEYLKLADDLIASSKCEIREIEQNNAFYSPTQDCITLPPRHAFKNTESFLAVTMHEMAHSTGHESRLNRNIRNEFGSPEYAKEELRAEISSYFLQNDLGSPISAENLVDHSNYLLSWISALEEDYNELFRACRDADEISTYLHNNYEEYMQTMEAEMSAVHAAENMASEVINNAELYDNFVITHAKLLDMLSAETNNRSLIVNAYAGPGAGKTTSCLQLVADLKKHGISAEYVSEYAKDLVWEKNSALLDGSPESQFTILKEQLRRMDRLYGQVDVIVTDAPILLNQVYNNHLTPEYKKMLSALNEQYNSYNFFIERFADRYETQGRLQTLEESQTKDAEIASVLKENHIVYDLTTPDNLQIVYNNSVFKHQQNIQSYVAEQNYLALFDPPNAPAYTVVTINPLTGEWEHALSHEQSSMSYEEALSNFKELAATGSYTTVDIFQLNDISHKCQEAVSYMKENTDVPQLKLLMKEAKMAGENYIEVNDKLFYRRDQTHWTEFTGLGDQIIDRVNEISPVHAGTQIENEYLGHAKKIISMQMDYDIQKQALEHLRNLSYEELYSYIDDSLDQAISIHSKKQEFIESLNDSFKDPLKMHMNESREMALRAAEKDGLKQIEIDGRTIYKNGSEWSYADPNYIRIANELRSAGYQPSDTLVSNILKVHEYAEKKLSISDLKSLCKTPLSPAQPDEYLSLIKSIDAEFTQQEALVVKQIVVAEA